MIKSELKIIMQLQNFGQIPLGSGHDITMTFGWMDGVFANNETDPCTLATESSI